MTDLLSAPTASSGQHEPANLRLQIQAVGVGAQPTDYLLMLQRQRELHRQRVAGSIGDTILLTEHASVYTAGKRTSRDERPISAAQHVQVVDVDRGGRITWHGPGQIVGYPILTLPQPLDVLAYVRTLEQVLIDTCAVFGIAAYRVDGRSGVWAHSGQGQAQGPQGQTKDAAKGTEKGHVKIAAIGVRVAQGVSMHGFALNVNCALAPFTQITPCGISDAGVSSLSALGGSVIGEAAHGTALPTTDVLPVLTDQLRTHLRAYLPGVDAGSALSAAVAPAADPTATDPTTRDTRVQPARIPTVPHALTEHLHD